MLKPSYPKPPQILLLGTYKNWDQQGLQKWLSTMDGNWIRNTPVSVSLGINFLHSFPQQDWVLVLTAQIILPLFCNMYFGFAGHIQWCSWLSPGSGSRDYYFWLSLGNYMEYQRVCSGWLCAKSTPYSLWSCSSLSSAFISAIFLSGLTPPFPCKCLLGSLPR